MLAENTLLTVSKVTVPLPIKRVVPACLKYIEVLDVESLVSKSTSSCVTFAGLAQNSIVKVVD